MKMISVRFLFFSLIATIIFGTQGVMAQAPLQKKFSDLASDHKNTTAIEFLRGKGVIEGYADGTFQPEKTVNRAEQLKILIEGQGISPDSSVYHNCFPDVKDEWFAKYVCYAKDRAWIEGYPDGTFKPAQTVNKVESIKMMVETREELKAEIPEVVPEEIYEDTDRNEWYAPYVYVAKKKAILEETGAVLNPTEGMKRAGISENIYRAIKVKEEKKPKFENVQYEELFVPKRPYKVVTHVLTPPRQYALSSDDVSFLDFSVTANETVTVKTLAVQIDAIPSPFNPAKGNLINDELSVPNFSDFKIVDKNTGAVYFDPVELSTSAGGEKRDLRQVLMFKGSWTISGGTTVDLSMTADVADQYDIANTHFFATLLRPGVHSEVYDAKGNSVTDIFPERDVKGGLITPRIPVDFTVRLSPSQPASFVVPAHSNHSTFMNLDFVAGSTDDVQIRGLSLLMKGDVVVDSLYLYEGDVRLTGPASIDGKTGLVSFDSLGTMRSQVVMPNEKRTFTVRGSLGANTAGATILFELPDASFLKVSAPTVQGTFPLLSSLQTVTGDVSELLGVSNNPVSLNPSVNERGAQIASFVVGSTTYSVSLSLGSIALRMEGEIAIPDMTDFVLKHGDSVLSTAKTSINEMGQDLIVFDIEPQFSFSGKEVLDVYADIGPHASAGESLSIFLDDPVDAVAYNSSGYGVPVSTDYDNHEWYGDYSSWSYLSGAEEPAPDTGLIEIDATLNSGNPASSILYPSDELQSVLSFGVTNNGGSVVILNQLIFGTDGTASLFDDFDNFYVSIHGGSSTIQGQIISDGRESVRFGDGEMFSLRLEPSEKQSITLLARVSDDAAAGNEHTFRLDSIHADSDINYASLLPVGNIMTIGEVAAE